MLDANGQPKTSHTTRLVPLIVAGDKKKLSGLSMARAVGGLKDVAPTVCHLLGVAVPKEMTGVSMLAAAAAAAPPASAAAAPAK
jgi:2,3-bisphosphoglycerate-independent phosphoglycerate mutase